MDRFGLRWGLSGAVEGGDRCAVKSGRVRSSQVSGQIKSGLRSGQVRSLVNKVHSISGPRHRAEAGSAKEEHRKVAGEREIAPHDLRNLAGGKQQVRRLSHQSLQKEDQETKEERKRKRLVARWLGWLVARWLGWLVG